MAFPRVLSLQFPQLILTMAPLAAELTIASNTSTPCRFSSCGIGNGLFAVTAAAKAVSSALSVSKPGALLTSAGGATFQLALGLSGAATKRNSSSVAGDSSTKPFDP